MGPTSRSIGRLGLARLALPRLGLPTQARERAEPPEPFAALPFIAIAGLAVSVAVVVASTPIGSGDYGQWLMVARQFVGASTPAYRDLSQTAPGVPLAIAVAGLVLGDPIAALHAVGFAIVAGLAGALFVAGWVFGRRPLAGILAAAIGLLVTDQLLDLIAFGGLPQAAGIIGSILAMTAFARAAGTPRHERLGWALGCGGLFLACIGHVATATVALPACLAVAALGVGPRFRPDEPSRAAVLRALRAGVRSVWPLGLAFAVVGGYWLVAVVPASQGLVTNPASLSYRGPERVIATLSDSWASLAVVILGGASLAAWVLGEVRRRRLPAARDPWLVLAVWTAASWGAYGWSAITGTSTDYPRFGPILVAPLVVAAAAGVGAAAVRVVRAVRIRPTDERGIVALGLAIAFVAPFSFARFETSARGYELTDAASLEAAAAWVDSRLVPGAAVLAPVREGKWLEGLTGRPALFSSAIRYSFRPDEWERSLAARAILQGHVAIANESFVATLTDDVAASSGTQPRGLLITANHGGEDVDLLRLDTEASGLVDASGTPIARLASLTPAGLREVQSPDSIVASSSWSAERQGASLAVDERLALAQGSTTMTLSLDVGTSLEASGLELDLRPASFPILSVTPMPTTSGDSTTVPGASRVAEPGAAAVLGFPPLGRSAPRLELELDGPGTIQPDGSGGVLVTASGTHLGLAVTDLTAGGASSGLQVLDAAQLVQQYQVGGAILLHDASYADRERRLELLGFHPVDAEGPYVVLVRSSAVLRPTPVITP